MKKITLVILGSFVVILAGIYLLGWISFSSPAPASNNQTALANEPIPPAPIPASEAIFNSPDIALPQPTQPEPQTAPGTFTAQDVASHNSSDDCYLIINNNVYDVSNYIGMHPGGRSIIISRCGTEVTGIFAMIHSNRAWDLLADYKVGEISATTATAPEPTPLTLSAIQDGLQKANPDAEVLNVKPKQDFFVAKIVYQGKLYEVHLNQDAQIVKEEIANDEVDWSVWDTDPDDE